jgi:hypothetical protein
LFDGKAAAVCENVLRQSGCVDADPRRTANPLEEHTLQYRYPLAVIRGCLERIFHGSARPPNFV